MIDLVGKCWDQGPNTRLIVVATTKEEISKKPSLLIVVSRDSARYSRFSVACGATKPANRWLAAAVNPIVEDFEKILASALVTFNKEAALLVCSTSNWSEDLVDS